MRTYQLNKYNKAWLEYKFSRNTDFICRRLPGIAWNILRNLSLQFTEMFSASLAMILFACKNVAFYTKQDFAGALTVLHITLYLGAECSSVFLSESIDCERKSLDFEGHTWNRGKCGDIHTGIQTYLHQKISNEAGFQHRQPRLVTYATWISLLRSLVPSQQKCVQRILLSVIFAIINKQLKQYNVVKDIFTADQLVRGRDYFSGRQRSGSWASYSSIVLVACEGAREPI